MKLKKIFNERPDIEKRVMEDYPVTKAEKKCSIEKGKREELRWERAKRYYSQIDTEVETK